jgi:hypothetical protein
MMAISKNTMKKIKNQCWFYHNFNVKLYFKIQRIGGKIAREPVYRSIVLVYRCNECLKTREEFHSTVSSYLAENLVKSLNFEFNLKSN